MILTNIFEASRNWFPATLVALAAALRPASALADEPAPPQRGLAEQLFEEGRALTAQGKARQACPKFQAAARYTQSPGVRLNLARCWATIGKTASAWAMYAEALTAAERVGDEAATNAAREGRDEIVVRLSYLVVSVPEHARLQGLSVSRDDEPVPTAAWGTPVPVDPGRHRVSATAPGRNAWSLTVDVAAANDKRMVTIPELSPARTAASPRGSSPRREEDGGSIGPQRTLALVSAGAGLVGVGVGTYFGIRMIAKRHDYEASTGSDGQCLDAQCESDSHDAFRAGTISTIGWVAGGALLATGAALWFTAPSKREMGRAALHPLVAPRGAGLAYSGTF
jgi:hypothetical protein